jgi:hypothetical protein
MFIILIFFRGLRRIHQNMVHPDSLPSIPRGFSLSNLYLRKTFLSRPSLGLHAPFVGPRPYLSHLGFSQPELSAENQPIARDGPPSLVAIYGPTVHRHRPKEIRGELGGRTEDFANPDQESRLDAMEQTEV